MFHEIDIISHILRALKDSDVTYEINLMVHMKLLIYIYYVYIKL